MVKKLLLLPSFAELIILEDLQGLDSIILEKIESVLIQQTLLMIKTPL